MAIRLHPSHEKLFEEIGLPVCVAERVIRKGSFQSLIDTKCLGVFSDHAQGSWDGPLPKGSDTFISKDGRCSSNNRSVTGEINLHAELDCSIEQKLTTRRRMGINKTKCKPYFAKRCRILIDKNAAFRDSCRRHRHKKSTLEGDS